MTQATMPDQPVPHGTHVIGDWEDTGPHRYRVVCGDNRQITDHPLTVSSSAVQWADGSVDDGRIEGPHIYVYDLGEGSPLNSDQARELAAVLLETAAQLDGWTTK